MIAPNWRRVPCRVCGLRGIVLTLDGTCQPCDRWATRCMRYLMAKALGVQVHP